MPKRFFFRSKVEGANYAVMALIAFAAACINLGNLHQFDNGDSIVPVLVSTQRWTPFFWGSNRFGMLIPLLAAPFHNLLANLIVQEALTTFAALACSFLLIRYLFGNSPFWFTAAALQNTWLILLVPKWVMFDWFVVNCYGVSFALAFAALILCDKKKWTLAVIFILLAHWVNFGACILLIPLLFIRYLFQRDGRRFVASLLLVLVGALAGWALMHLSPYHETRIRFLPPSEWLNSWWQVIRSTQQMIVGKSRRFLWWMVLPSSLGTLVLLGRSRIRIVLLAVSVILAAVFYWLVVCAQVWVRMSLYWPRYIYASLLLVGIAMAILTVGPLEGLVHRDTTLALSATILMLVSAAACYGRPSLANVHEVINRRFGHFTPEILAGGATVVAGNYWTVWPAVFHANLTLQERGEHRIIYGLSYRSGTTNSSWAHRPGLCVAVPDHDSEANFWIAHAGLRLSHVRDYNTIQTFCEP